MLAAGSGLLAGPDLARAAETGLPLIYDRYGGLFIEVRIEGRPARMILDTGASRSALDAAFAAKLGLPLETGGQVEGTAGTEVARAASVRLEIGSVFRRTVDVTVYGLGSYDPACVGILGQEFLDQAPLRIDYAAGRLVWRARPPRDTRPMTLDNGIPSVEAAVNGRPMRLRLDTGASLSPGAVFYVNLTQAQARDAGLSGKPLQVFSAGGTGAARLELPVHALDRFELCGRALAPARAIVQPPVGYFARPDAVGFLGNATLDKIGPYFDYAAGRFGCTVSAQA